MVCQRLHIRLVVALVVGGVVSAPGVASADESAQASGAPGRATTGVPEGTELQPYYGNLVITTPGARYDALDIHGFVTVAAPDVRITRSIIRGGYGTYGVNTGLITSYTGSLVLEDSELVPEHPSVSLDGISGSHFTLRRVDIHGTVDGVKIFGDDVRIESSWVHDFVDYPSDPYQGGGPSHNDGVQILGGDDITLVGNRVRGASNSALLITQDYAAATDVQVVGNWFNGGNQSVGLMAKPLPTLTSLTLDSNRFGRATRYSNNAIATYGAVSFQGNGNVWHDNDEPVDVRRN